MAETWVERHGALIGGLIAFGVMFVLFAWGMKEAWEWLRSRLMWCDVVRIPRKGAKVCRLPPYQRHDPGQFSWCQGEECARDWQD